MTTHSADLLDNKGIGPKEVAMLKPNPEGTKMELADSVKRIKQLMESGLTAGAVVIPETSPKNPEQLPLSFSS